MHERQPMPVGSGFITGFVVAMHESRRNRAAGEIRQHHHLVREAEAYENRRSAELHGQRRAEGFRRGSAGLALAAKAAVAAALVAFAVIHAMGGAMIHASAKVAAMEASRHTLAAD